MIKTFATKPTAALFAGYVIKKLPPAIQQRARERLVMLDSVTVLEELLVPRIDWNHSRVIERGSTVLESMSNGVSALFGKTAVPMMLK